MKQLNHEECLISTFIDEQTLTFGQGELHGTGTWEVPCNECAKAYRTEHPEAKVWIEPETESVK